MPNTKVRSYPNLLLITPGTMNGVGGGSVLFKTLLQNISTNQLCWAAVGGWTKEIPAWMKDRDRIICVSPWFHRYVRYFAQRIPILRNLWSWYVFRWFPAQAVKKIARFAKEEYVEKIWVHATGQTIPVAVKLRKMLGLPVHVNIQDDIYGHSASDGEWIRREFGELLKSCTTCDVTSDSMKEYYVEKYDACHNAHVFWNGCVLGETPPSPELKRNIKNITYTGNIWCPDTVRILLSALKILNVDRSAENQIRLKIYSQRLKWHFNLNQSNINYCGVLKPEEVVTVVQADGLMYVPMSFLPEKEILCRTSLPGKMLTYMQAQVPLFAHGPEYASNVRFVGSRGIGMVCTSMDPAEVAKAILRYEHDYDSRVEASRRCRELCENDFNPEHVWERFRKVLFAI